MSTKDSARMIVTSLTFLFMLCCIMCMFIRVVVFDMSLNEFEYEFIEQF